MEEGEGFGLARHFEVVAKVLERAGWLPLMVQRSLVFAVPGDSRHFQVSEAASELEAMMVEVKSLTLLVANLAGMWAEEEQIEPKAVGVDLALLPRNSWGAGHVLDAGPRMVEFVAEAGQALVPTDSNWEEVVLEVVLDLLGSKEAEFDHHFVKEAMC